MGSDRFLSLNDQQKDCLRLVAQGYTSKEIARRLGVHYRTIDQRLDRVRKLIGEPDRPAAARAFALHEATAEPREGCEVALSTRKPAPDDGSSDRRASGPDLETPLDRPLQAAVAHDQAARARVDVSASFSMGLGPANRGVAASAVGSPMYDTIIYDPPPVVPETEASDDAASRSDRVQDNVSAFGHVQRPRRNWLAVLNPFDGRCPDDVPPIERLAFALRLSAWVPMSMGALWLGLNLLLHLLWRIIGK